MDTIFIRKKKVMKRGKLNKARAILCMIRFIEEYVQDSYNYPELTSTDLYLLKLSEDLKRKRISRVTKKFIRYHMFFDGIVT